MSVRISLESFIRNYIILVLPEKLYATFVSGKFIQSMKLS